MFYLNYYQQRYKVINMHDKISSQLWKKTIVFHQLIVMLWISNCWLVTVDHGCPFPPAPRHLRACCTQHQVWPGLRWGLQLPSEQRPDFRKRMLSLQWAYKTQWNGWTIRTIWTGCLGCHDKQLLIDVCFTCFYSCWTVWLRNFIAVGSVL